ncbi:MAG: glycosyl hydrolase 115 family protein [Prevotella sp.]|nr:glycosyl hydrolase 115 family protein [Prevotella sp.]
MKKQALILFLFCMTLISSAADQFVSFQPTKGGMAIATGGKPVDILVSEKDHEGVLIAARNLQKDLQTVCGNTPALTSDLSSLTSPCIIVGSLQSEWIQQMVAKGKVYKKELAGKTEKYVLQLVDNPLPNVKQALLIAGSDKRGTIYGIYELSRQIGVSPWYWWLDVPAEHHKDLYIKKGLYSDGEPKVAYRGIFINDEWPSFGEWAKEKFGGINAKCYEHVFELLLRLKGNYMWPAMWASAFYDDDKENGPLADRMGVIMGTSHHEPMALAQQDWKRRKGHGSWSFEHNQQEMLDFWRGGVERAKGWETMYTIGMRGDGDTKMEDHATVQLMEDIVAKQRQLLTQVTGKPASEVPQVWALYKEVQDFYDQGMQVPDDVTLLLCDDNWGNVRRLPALGSKKRKGGYGMYYHFDYVGGPRNTKWINVSPIPRVWEQMNLTYHYGVDKMWIVNVGDLKPMEYPITFFLDMAWNPDQFNAHNLTAHADAFCASIFGEQHAKEASRLLRTYAKWNRRVTPELLNSKTYSMNYDEWARVTTDYNQLAQDAENLAQRLPQNLQDTWFQLLGYPIKAMANLYQMYYAQAMNQRLAKKDNPQANDWAGRVRECFEHDSLLTLQYHAVAGGKWNHMMDQIHIGYKSWNNPKTRMIPEVTIVQANGEKQEMRSEKKETVEGYVTIEAEHWTRKTDGKEAKWLIIPDLGRTLSAITPTPVTASVDGMSLEYDMNLDRTGNARVVLRFAPTLNFNVDGLRYAISFDGGEEQIVNINGHYKGELGQWQTEHVIDSETIHIINKTGKHTLRIRPLDNALVLQKILVNMGGHHKSYLWAPETMKN